MNKLKLLSALAVFSSFSVLYLSSCKDDDEPAPRAKVEFSSSTVTVNENQGSLPVTIELDRAAPEDVVVEYSISGTATRRTSTNTATADYEITGTIGEVEIEQGQTSATINIGILNDGIYEEDETIILTIEDVDSDRVDFGERIQTTITIVSDDAGVSVSFELDSPPAPVNEADRQIIEVKVNVTPAPTSDIVVSYDLSPWFDDEGVLDNIAIDSLSAFENEVSSRFYDYYIDGVSGQLAIPAGSSSGTIRIVVLSDRVLENTETFELTLKATPGVVVDNSNSKFTVTVDQEDCRIVALVWPDDLTVDLDLIVWAKAPADPDWSLFDISAFPGTEIPEEYILIKKWVMDELEDEGLSSVEFGGSYIYYSGTSDPLDYRVAHMDFINGEFEPEDEMEITDAIFTLDDINAWETLADIKPSGDDNWVPMQTWTYQDGVFGTPSDISNPEGRLSSTSKSLPKNFTRRLFATPKNLSDLKRNSRVIVR